MLIVQECHERQDTPTTSALGQPKNTTPMNRRGGAEATRDRWNLEEHQRQWSERVRDGSSRDIWGQTYESSATPDNLLARMAVAISRQHRLFSLLPSSNFHNAMFLENVFTQQRRCGMTWSTPPASCRLHPQVGIYCCCTQVLAQTLVGQPLPSVVVDSLLDIGGFYHRQAAQHPGSMDDCRMGGEGGEKGKILWGAMRGYGPRKAANGTRYRTKG